MLSASELKGVLRANGLHLTKRLGQNHLVDERVIRRIVEACACGPDESVVEIGAGLGALTEPLAGRARAVLAVEVDRKVAALLAGRMRHLPNVDVAHEDILEIDAERFRNAVVVGAIPYHITSPIFVRLTEHRQLVRRVILVIQDEVAQRMLAGPGTKSYGRLSVLAQYGWDVSSVFDVPAGAFFPQPEVGSRCLRLAPRSPAVSGAEEGALFELVRLAFGQRRKTLINCLTRQEGAPPTLTKADVEAALSRLGIAVTARGEELSLAQFVRLAGRMRGVFAGRTAR